MSLYGSNAFEEELADAALGRFLMHSKIHRFKLEELGFQIVCPSPHRFNVQSYSKTTSDSDKLSKKEYSQRLAKFLCEYGSQTLPYLKNAIDFIRMERPDVFNGQDNDIFFFVGWGLIVLSGKRVRVNDVFGGILSSMSLESHLKKYPSISPKKKRTLKTFEGSSVAVLRFISLAGFKEDLTKRLSGYGSIILHFPSQSIRMKVMKKRTSEACQIVEEFVGQFKLVELRCSMKTLTWMSRTYPELFDRSLLCGSTLALEIVEKKENSDNILLHIVGLSQQVEDLLRASERFCETNSCVCNPPVEDNSEKPAPAEADTCEVRTITHQVPIPDALVGEFLFNSKLHGSNLRCENPDYRSDIMQLDSQHYVVTYAAASETMQEQWKSDCENELRRHLQCYHSGVLPNAPIVIDYIRAHWPEVHRGVDEDLKTVIRQGSVWVTGLRCKVRKLTKQAAHATKIKCRRRKIVVRNDYGLLDRTDVYTFKAMHEESTLFDFVGATNFADELADCCSQFGPVLVDSPKKSVRVKLSNKDQEAHVDQTVKKFFQAFAHEKFRLPQTEMSLVFDKYAHMFSQNADVDITMTLAPKATVQILHLWGKKDKVEKILLEIKLLLEKSTYSHGEMLVYERGSRTYKIASHRKAVPEAGKDCKENVADVLAKTVKADECVFQDQIPVQNPNIGEFLFKSMKHQRRLNKSMSNCQSSVLTRLESGKFVVTVQGNETRTAGDNGDGEIDHGVRKYRKVGDRPVPVAVVPAFNESSAASTQTRTAGDNGDGEIGQGVRKYRKVGDRPVPVAVVPAFNESSAASTQIPSDKAWKRECSENFKAFLVKYSSHNLPFSELAVEYLQKQHPHILETPQNVLVSVKPKILTVTGVKPAVRRITAELIAAVGITAQLTELAREQPVVNINASQDYVYEYIREDNREIFAFIAVAGFDQELMRRCAECGRLTFDIRNKLIVMKSAKKHADQLNELIDSFFSEFGRIPFECSWRTLHHLHQQHADLFARPLVSGQPIAMEITYSDLKSENRVVVAVGKRDVIDKLLTRTSSYAIILNPKEKVIWIDKTLVSYSSSIKNPARREAKMGQIGAPNSQTLHQKFSG